MKTHEQIKQKCMFAEVIVSFKESSVYTIKRVYGMTYFQRETSEMIKPVITVINSKKHFFKGK